MAWKDLPHLTDDVLAGFQVGYSKGTLSQYGCFMYEALLGSEHFVLPHNADLNIRTHKERTLAAPSPYDFFSMEFTIDKDPQGVEAIVWVVTNAILSEQELEADKSSTFRVFQFLGMPWETAIEKHGAPTNHMSTVMAWKYSTVHAHFEDTVIVTTEEDGSTSISGIGIGYDPDDKTLSQQEAEKEFSGNYIWAADKLIDFLNVLNCKNVTVQEHAPSSRLARLRRQANKRPFVTYNTVEIGVRAIHTTHTTKSVAEHSLEHRSSPRLHWRRAHIRHFDDGTTTMVRQAVVGDIANGVAMKEYSVHRQTEAPC